MLQTPTTIADDLLTTTAAARLIQRSGETIRQWARVGRLVVAARSQSGIRLFRPEDVLAAVRADKHTAA